MADKAAAINICKATKITKRRGMDLPLEFLYYRKSRPNLYTWILISRTRCLHASQADIGLTTLGEKGFWVMI